VLEWAPARSSGTAVLVHGHLDAAASWELVAPTLARADLRVLAPDLRGCGDGPTMPEGASYQFVDHVRDLLELLEGLCDKRPVYLVGHSLGGLIALSFAGSFPERVGRLALLEGVGMAADTLESAPLRLRRWCIAGSGATKDKPFGFDDALARFAVRYPELSETLLQERIRHLVRSTGGDRYVWKSDPRVRAGAESPAPEVLKAFLKQIACPVLAVGGGVSPARAPDEADRLAVCPSLRSTELEGAGHMMHWTRPDAVADLLVAFFRASTMRGSCTTPDEQR
jgi:pimeloyl-ACP methyl ester carboxylesterase